ncbi:PHB depolymerase family esterase [Aestuariibacter sp. A3R04]|uniref:extracellular catalytic domain type 2 short-chain-length polyhydroxyalkanoate depolymerase n=1 Tax=Aestuariibacter sp. A3R04 TaxID=2841571 RepID=UPI001C09CDAC|nr:PHB depolymerase family esterase [Aestuariibacter sp. A3R04]MBU3022537.1 polyhydroxybutyrate depolymerase [Aestuariibacter sp. A3R04]
MKILLPLTVGIASLVAAQSATAQSSQLNLKTDSITVSGLSSGGYMANQFHLAYSDWVKGAGILAAGPYYCAQGDIGTALEQCVDNVEPALDVAALTAQLKRWEKENKIAPLSNLASDKVWLFHGTRDTRVSAAVSDALTQQYRSLIKGEQIKYVDDKPVAHLFPTLANGNVCMTSESPYIGRCDYDAAGAMLNFLLPELNDRTDTPTGSVITFDQRALAGSDANTMAEKGYAYVPKTCKEGEPCDVHVSFHGCNQYADAVGKAYVEQTGINNWADTNHLVVVYPQTRKSLFMPLNPQGCWDWWGYTGDDYATRDGKQLKAIRNIVLGLSSK